MSAQLPIGGTPRSLTPLVAWRITVLGLLLIGAILFGRDGSAPMLVLQGTDDVIVLPENARRLAESTQIASP
jgi:hypothetical protein